MKAPLATPVVRLVISLLIALSASACTMDQAPMATTLVVEASEEATAAEEAALVVEEAGLVAGTPTTMFLAQEQV